MFPGAGVPIGTETASIAGRGVEPGALGVASGCRAATSACPSSGRADGSFSRQRDTSAATAGEARVMGGAGAVITTASRPSGVSAWKGRRPSIISKSRVPNAWTSAWASAG
jgi:hypothetical protein